MLDTIMFNNEEEEIIKYITRDKNVLISIPTKQHHASIDIFKIIYAYDNIDIKIEDGTWFPPNYFRFTTFITSCWYEISEDEKSTTTYEDVFNVYHSLENRYADEEEIKDSHLAIVYSFVKLKNKNKLYSLFERILDTYNFEKEEIDKIITDFNELKYRTNNAKLINHLRQLLRILKKHKNQLNHF